MEENAYLSLVFSDKTHLPVQTWRISSVPFDGENHIHKNENLASGPHSRKQNGNCGPLKPTPVCLSCFVSQYNKKRWVRKTLFGILSMDISIMIHSNYVWNPDSRCTVPGLHWWCVEKQLSKIKWHSLNVICLVDNREYLLIKEREYESGS